MNQHTPGCRGCEQSTSGDCGGHYLEGFFGESEVTGVLKVQLTATQELIGRMARLIETSLRAGRFPEVGDGCEVWRPADTARALLKEIDNG